MRAPHNLVTSRRDSDLPTIVNKKNNDSELYEETGRSREDDKDVAHADHRRRGIRLSGGSGRGRRNAPAGA